MIIFYSNQYQSIDYRIISIRQSGEYYLPSLCELGVLASNWISICIHINIYNNNNNSGNHKN